MLSINHNLRKNSKLIALHRPESVVIHFNQANRDLELVSNIDEVKETTDRTEALRVSTQAAIRPEMQNCWAEIKFRAERRAGGIPAEMRKQ